MDLPKDWNEFINFIDPCQHMSLQREKIQKIVKVPSMKELSFAQISSYYSNKFQITRNAQRSKWHDEDKYFLIWCVSKLVEKMDIQYKELDSHKVFQTLSNVLLLPEDFILNKWLSLLKQSLRDQPWTQDEDQILIDLKEKYIGKSQWTQITKEFIKMTQTVRYQKQIRERYNNVINPNINKSPFSPDDIMLILRRVEEKGKHWASISKQLPGRTDNKIKNIYNSVLRKIGKKIGRNFEDPMDEQFILSQIKLCNTYDPTELFHQIERGQRKQVCVKVEATQESSSAIFPIQPPRTGNTVLYCQPQHPQQFYFVPQPFVFCPGSYYPLKHLEGIHLKMQ